MHLFLFDLYISLDILIPIINTLNKKNKILIYSVNPIQNYEKDSLTKFIKNKNVTYKGFLPIKKNQIIFFYLIKLMKCLPNIVQKKIQFIWIYIYKKKVFSDVEIVKNLLIKYKVKSITFEEGVPPNYLKFFVKASRLLNIPMIKVPAGVHTVNPPNLKKDLFDSCDFYIAPSQIYKKKKLLKNKKIKYFGSLRYSKYWIKNLKKIFPLKQNNKKKMNIGIFSKHQANEHQNLNKLIIKLKYLNYLNVKIREKPRDVTPLKFAKFYNDELNSSQLIHWSDYILSSRSSSVLIEAVIANKKIFLLKYLYDEKNYSNLSKYNFIIKINNEKDILKLINKNISISQKERLKCLKNILINYGKEKKMINSYRKFYSNL